MTTTDEAELQSEHDSGALPSLRPLFAWPRVRSRLTANSGAKLGSFEACGRRKAGA